MRPSLLPVPGVLDAAYRDMVRATVAQPGAAAAIAAKGSAALKRWFDAASQGGAGSLVAPTGPVPGNLTSWIRLAMGITGVPASWLGPLQVIAMHESGGNPRAINLWDSNAQRGDPSRGLMQTIGSTFRAHMLPGHGDIWNPVDNAIAAIRYIQGRYHDISRVPGIASMARGGPYRGYAKGGITGRGAARALEEGASLAPVRGARSTSQHALGPDPAGVRGPMAPRATKRRLAEGGIVEVPSTSRVASHAGTPHSVDRGSVTPIGAAVAHLAEGGLVGGRDTRATEDRHGVDVQRSTPAKRVERAGDSGWVPDPHRPVLGLSSVRHEPQHALAAWIKKPQSAAAVHVDPGGAALPVPREARDTHGPRREIEGRPLVGRDEKQRGARGLATAHVLSLSPRRVAEGGLLVPALGHEQAGSRQTPRRLGRTAHVDDRPDPLGFKDAQAPPQMQRLHAVLHPFAEGGLRHGPERQGYESSGDAGRAPLGVHLPPPTAARHAAQAMPLYGRAPAARGPAIHADVPAVEAHGIHAGHATPLSTSTAVTTTAGFRPNLASPGRWASGPTTTPSGPLRATEALRARGPGPAVPSLRDVKAIRVDHVDRFDTGLGLLKPGTTLATNTTGKPERVGAPQPVQSFPVHPAGGASRPNVNTTIELRVEKVISGDVTPEKAVAMMKREIADYAEGFLAGYGG